MSIRKLCLAEQSWIELIHSDYIPLDTQIDVIADTYIWPTVDDLARKSDAGESMSKSDRQASLALELLGRAASRIRLGQCVSIVSIVWA